MIPTGFIDSDCELDVVFVNIEKAESAVFAV